MAQFGYSAPAGRINVIKGEILAHAIPVEVLGITGQQRPIPKNSGKTVSYRRYLPYGGAITNFNTINRMPITAAAHILTEGTTPAADTLVPQDITVTLNQYGCLYQVSDQAVDLYEDNVPEEMKKQCGERVALIRELVRYGVVKASTNINYPGTIVSRVTINKRIDLSTLRRVSRNLQANHAKRITGVLAPSANIGTKAVEASFLVFCHSDCESDFRDMAGFVTVANYGSRKPIHEQELGSVENFRVICSPELASYPGAGVASAAGLTPPLYSAAAGAVDVYPTIVCGEDAWGQVALRGGDALDPTWIPPGQKDKSDPLGQRGFVGAKFYFNCNLLNEGWIAVIEAGVSAL